MRTRFLSVDYFNRASNEALENLNFLRLSVPHFPPSNICDAEEICCFDSVFSISLEIERFPIENALSRFFSDVLPHIIRVENEDFPVIFSRNQNAYADGWRNDGEQRNSRPESVAIRFDEEGSCCFDEERSTDKPRCFDSVLPHMEVIEKEAELLCEDKEVESQRTSLYETLESKILKKEHEHTCEKERNSFKVIQFETPALNCFLEELAFVSQKEERQIFSQIPKIKNPLDMLNFKLGVTIDFPCEISKSIYSVEDIPSEYHMEQRSSNFVEDAGFVQDSDRIHHCPSKLPFLEVNEIGMEYYTSPSMEEELHLLLENIGHQNWTHKADLMVDGKELLGFMDLDILECLSEHCPSKQCLEPELIFLDVAVEMDFISIKEATHLKEISVIYPEISDHGSFSTVRPLHFQEVQILDLDPFQSFEVFASSQTNNEAEICDLMFKEYMNSVGNFHESVISNELALVDDTFRLLPIPVLSDDKDIQLLSAIVEEILADIEPHFPSASDEIYLDWHLLEEDRCNHDIYSNYWNILEGIDTYSIDCELQSFNNETVNIDFVFCEDAPDGPKILESKEILNELTGAKFVGNEPLTKIAPRQMSKDEGQKPGKGELIPETSSEKVTMLFDSMSQFNDLDFFLNPHKATVRRKSEPAVRETSDNKAKLPGVPSSNPIVASASAEVQLTQWDIEVHQIQLSDHILGLIDNFQKSYLAILENDMDLKKTYCSFPVVGNFNLLSLRKQNLMDWIKNASTRQTSLACKDDTFMAFVTLYAIKQMAYYLCFYGIHATHLYADNLYRSLKYLRCRLSFLQSLIEEAYRKADIEITDSHPSLSVIQGILKSKTSQSGLKVLIVAEQVFWWPLKRLLTSMRILFHEVQDIHTRTDKPDAWDSKDFTKYTMDTLLHTDCILMSHEHVSASLPFNEFGIILEYGGSYGSSRIFTVSPKLVGLPRLHFLKVELDDFSVPKALCEGLCVPQNEEGISQSISTLCEGIKDQNFEELLNFVPVERNSISMESSEAADCVKACSVPISVSSTPFIMESKQIKSAMSSYPDIVIIVNTQNFDKEMLISRRSSYQRILAMEKQGVQVVEREINLPVDLIFSAAVCLVWYDCGNIGKKATGTDEAYSSVSLCVENIATNILTSLSFAFSSCILVFEGESSFLGVIMESSDALYAAAASLGVDLQLFCSYSSELTDEIILNCIMYATKSNRGLYPKMIETENLAESFLTSFPSINPLSAHAILSSGGMLIEFLHWSHGHRIQAIGKYNVPDRSLALFSAQCRYGEREESKSGMTECSSSVSSAPDSRNSPCKTESERKRRKNIMNPHTFDMSMTDLHSGQLNRSTDGNLKPSRVSQLYQSQMLFKGPEVLNMIEGSTFSLNDQLFGQKQGSNISVIKNLDWNGNNIENAHEAFKGEVIDLSNSSLLGEDFSSIANTTNFSTKVPDMRRDATAGNSTTTRRFDRSNLPSLPTSTEINSDLDIWNSLQDQNQILEGNICGHLDIESKDTLSLKCQRELSKGIMQGSVRYGGGLLFQEKVTPSYGEKPLSNAIHSSQLQRGSPWTMEFLNRIKGKSKMRQQSLPSDTAAPCFGYSGHVEKISKRKSPSTLDCFRYQGGSNSKKVIIQKRQKRIMQPLTSSKNEKASASHPIWTPIDKRARQLDQHDSAGVSAQSTE